jgi:hypothetical protein
MIKNIIEDEEYKLLIEKQIKETVVFLLKKNQEFSITANIEPITFNPELPSVIKNQMHKFSLFTLSNYTYTTVQIDNDYLSFEAGFGNENFGSIVKIPLYAIFQIVVDESILYINSVATVDKFNKNLKKNSFNVFKSNPNNKKFDR